MFILSSIFLGGGGTGFLTSSGAGAGAKKGCGGTGIGGRGPYISWRDCLLFGDGARGIKIGGCSFSFISSWGG